MESLLNLSKNNDNPKSVMKQAEQIWSMLDDMLETDHESYKKFIEKTIKEGKEAIKQSNPEPKICVKAKLINGTTLYINILAWSKVPAPENDTKPIPIYGKKIQVAKNDVVNVVLNPAIFEKINFKQTILNLTFDYIEEQNKVEIDRNNSEILETAAYFGDLDEIVRSLSGPNPKSQTSSQIESNLPENLITKLASLGTSEPVKDSSTVHDLTSPKIPVYEEKMATNKQGAYFSLKIYLPMIDSFSQCDLKVDAVKKRLILDTSKKDSYKQLIIPLEKLDVDFNQVEAKFVKKEKILRVKINLVKNFI